MLLLLIWIIPIVALFIIKWYNADDNSTIQNLLATTVSPMCNDCRACNYFPILDGIIFIPIVGFLYILFIILIKPIEKAS